MLDNTVFNNLNLNVKSNAGVLLNSGSLYSYLGGQPPS